MKRLRAVFLIFVFLLLLAGCGQKEDLKKTTAVAVLKDGSIVSTVVEVFDREYYNEAELSELIENDIKDYNEEAGEEAIKLDNLDFKDGSAEMKLKFKNAESYAGFNGVEFFAGTVAEAYEAGYSLDLQLKNSEAEGEGMGKSELLASGDMFMIIAEEPVLIKTFKNIGYTSENVTLVGKKEAAAMEDSDTQAYILFN